MIAGQRFKFNLRFDEFSRKLLFIVMQFIITSAIFEVVYRSVAVYVQHSLHKSLGEARVSHCWLASSHCPPDVVSAIGHRLKS